MSRISISRAKYKFQHYEQTSAKITPYNDGYQRKLYRDQYHTSTVKLNIPDNVSDLIYGKYK